MMTSKFQLLLLLLAAMSHTEGQQIKRLPCEEDVCFEGTRQVGCEPLSKYKTFATSCTSQPYYHKYMPVNGNLRGTIVQYVNVLRNSVASGLFNMSAAARMPIVSWDEDLATAARIQVHDCNPDSDLCPNMNKYKYVVTVELRASYKSRHPRVLNDMRNIILPIWFRDVYGCRMRSDGRIKPIGEGFCVGHYIPLIQDHGSRIGCAMRISESIDTAVNSTVTMMCNLSRAGVNGMPPYKVGKQPAEECVTGKSLLYENLCRRSEDVDNNYLPSQTTTEKPCDCPEGGGGASSR